jgi:hypothetical protein
MTNRRFYRIVPLALALLVGTPASIAFQAAAAA